MNKLILILSFISVVALGFFVSRGSIPNQEGYAELSWNLNHLDFSKSLLAPMATPLIFLTAWAIEKVLPVSIASVWKIMDLTFAGLTAVFLTWIYWREQKPRLIGELIPVLVIVTSVGYIYSFTSGSGEGMPIFFAVTGIFYWRNSKFIRGALLFALSFLSKYTMYLIGPGVVIWTLFKLRFYSKKQLVYLFLGALIFLAVFISYHSLKGWSDIKLHTPYINSLSMSVLLNNFPPYFLALVLGAPIIVILSLLYPSFGNLYWLAGVSALVMLLRRYFYWNHAQQVIVFWMLYIFSQPRCGKLIKKRYILMQAVLFLSLIVLLPVTSGGMPIFYKHMTKAESFAIECIISLIFSLKEYLLDHN